MKRPSKHSEWTVTMSRINRQVLWSTIHTALKGQLRRSAEKKVTAMIENV